MAVAAPAPVPVATISATATQARPATPTYPKSRVQSPKSLDEPVTMLKGVREATALLLSRMEVHTVRDALYFFPRRYDDFSALKPISALTYGQVETIIGTIWNVEVRRTRSNRAMVTATLADNSGSIQATWFGQDYLARQLREGTQYVLSGKVEEWNGRLTMSSPEWEPYDTELLHTGRLVPIYRLTEGLSKRVIRKIIYDAVERYAGLIQDALPDTTRARAGLIPLAEAIRQIHFPDSWAALESARRRLAFDEFFLIQLGMLQRKQHWQHDQPGLAFGIRQDVVDNFIGSLPFELTGAQQRVLGELLEDMTQPVPMARLIQGDVGSGKTVVAAAALLAAVADGAQGALMAPTEILAEQHYKTLSRLFKHFWLPIGDANPKLAEVAARLAAAQEEIRAAAQAAEEADPEATTEDEPETAEGKPKRRKKTVAADTRTFAKNETIVDAPVQLSPEMEALKALLGELGGLSKELKPDEGPPPGYRPLAIHLLTGGMRKRERERVYEAVADGSCDILIGTHALIVEGLRYARLGLVVIDEQHRFGVNQRELLRQKAAELGLLADTLVMTATPIPRSLALTIYGDLDVSVINEMPPGRQVIRTRWVDDSRRDQAYNFIRKKLEEGRQCFIICPLVEESDKIDAKAAVAEHERLSTEVFPEYRLALLHGRMKAGEKDQIMAAFRRHEYDILVSTSVVEVGIDIPNATVILIEGAERFGLSQLHQFRGRVGRGEHQSYCILLSETALSSSMERLRVIEDTHDGFVLAEEDLRLRGPGEFFGTRQSGVFDLRMARLSDMDTLELARRESAHLYELDPTLDQPEHALLRAQLARFWELASTAPEA
jgi:ATP-dependent DNA helicase RecG